MRLVFDLRKSDYQEPFGFLKPLSVLGTCKSAGAIKLVLYFLGEKEQKVEWVKSLPVFNGAKGLIVESCSAAVGIKEIEHELPAKFNNLKYLKIRSLDDSSLSMELVERLSRASPQLEVLNYQLFEADLSELQNRVLPHFGFGFKWLTLRFCGPLYGEVGPILIPIAVQAQLANLMGLQLLDTKDIAYCYESSLQLAEVELIFAVDVGDGIVRDWMRFLSKLTHLKHLHLSKIPYRPSSIAALREAENSFFSLTLYGENSPFPSFFPVTSITKLDQIAWGLRPITSLDILVVPFKRNQNRSMTSSIDMTPSMMSRRNLDYVVQFFWANFSMVFLASAKNVVPVDSLD